MERLNSPLAGRFQDFLAVTVADDRRHVRFLNLLSLLEHLGSRKIMLSQMKGILTQEILKHLAEETRHAFFFKREAEKLCGRPVEGYDEADTLSPASGRLYFGRLDAGLTGTLPKTAHQETAYLWVSLIIEFRALWVYGAYQACLEAAHRPVSLRGIIAEEDRHLSDMVSRLTEIGVDVTATLPGAWELERRLFARFLGVLERAGGPDAGAETQAALTA